MIEPEVLVIVFVKVPYQVEMPGGIINLNDRVMVDDKIDKVDGSFGMAYVKVAQLSLLHFLVYFVNPNWDAVSIDDAKYVNETLEEANKRDRLYLEQSKSFAIAAALDAASIEYEVSNRINYVAYISSESKTDLKVGDNILKCGDADINEPNEVRKIIESKKVGEKIDFVVERDGKEVKAYAKSFDYEGSKIVGITILTTFDISSDVKVAISSRSSEAGPSGGMMMALSIYNAVTHQDLTHGKTIVGTGTINLDGTVGEIGGVKYKLIGAVNNGADVFLVPAENYKEAMEVKKKKGYNIEIVRIEKLQDAINYLEGLS